MKLTRSEWESYFNMEYDEDTINLYELEYLEDNFEDYISENDLYELAYFSIYEVSTIQKYYIEEVYYGTE